MTISLNKLNSLPIATLVHTPQHKLIADSSYSTAAQNMHMNVRAVEEILTKNVNKQTKQIKYKKGHSYLSFYYFQKEKVETCEVSHYF